MTPQELKNSILQLAIQGKLVEQRPEEGTAEELYKQIQAEKQALIKAGKIKKEKPMPEITEDEIPFEIPDSWKWYRIGEVFKIVNGFTPLKSNEDFWKNGDIPWFTIEDVHRQGRFISSTEKMISQKALSKNTERIVPSDSVLLCCTASVGEYAYTRIPLTTNQQFNAFVIKKEFTDVVFPMYVFEFARTLKDTLIRNAGKTTFNFVSVSKLSMLLFPLPPLLEQKRIVAKVEELLPLIDRYEKAWTRLEDFNKRFPGDMQKAFLQMAIQGKLVEQRPEEGTGEELYQQIQKEKQALIKAGKIKKEKPLPEITEDEIPFEIPESWMWVRLGVLSNINGGYAFKSTDYSVNGIRVVRISDFNESGFVNSKIVRHPFSKEYEPFLLEEKNILLCMTGGTVGKSFFVTKLHETMMVNQRVATIKIQQVLPEYINYNILAPLIQAIIQHSKNSTNDNISMETIKLFPVPLPPLAEQKRIVAKLEELLPLCERLK